MKLNFVKFCLVVALWIPSCLLAQDTKVLSEKMETVFRTLKPTDRKILIEGYISVMTSSFLSVEEKQMVDSVFQDLQNLHITVTPELQSYILCVNNFCLKEEKDNLFVWLKGIQDILSATDRKRMKIKAYLEVTTPLACQQYLFRGSSHQWQVQGKINWVAGVPVQVKFQNCDLSCMTRKDTIRIHSVNGFCNVEDEQLLGEGGEVNWKNTKGEMKVTLNHYEINLKNSGYSADSVLFRYESEYEWPLLGAFKDNALKYVRGEDAPFPEFVSYATDIKISGVYKNITFYGGISYRGSKLAGVGTKDQLARLEVVPNDTICMKLYSKQFLFDSLRIMSGHSAMEVVMDSGQITHSDIHFSYSVPHNTVSVKRISEQSIHLPFKDSYHQILFDMEEILWPVDSNYMEMRMSSRSGLFKATVESMNFFNDNVYDNIQGLDEINPLNGLLKCSIEQKSNTFTIGQYAEFLKKPADQLRKQIILLSYNDFVEYNESKDEVTLRQRLFDYTKARVGKQDYDNIRFTSQPGKARVNAVLDVRNYNLRIVGVDKFTISEARNIFVEPSDHQVVMMKNRDMAFNGKLNAGMFDMYGQNLFFSYGKYSIALPKVDSTSMYMGGKEKKMRGRKVGSLIRDISGEIVIDKPDNKSGKKEDPGFPVLNSTKESYVYFDESAIQGGKYKRDSFYYKIEPYKIKGINDASRFRYAFNGTLISNIVSPIRDTLRLLEDDALGMEYQTPGGGLELYGKGRIHSHISLSKKGFFAKGKVNMNKSEFDSDTILMLPEEMLAHTREIKVNAVKDKRPEAQGKDVVVKYLRETGNLQAISGTVPFEVYKGRIKHNGTLAVYEDLLEASGKLELEGAAMQSQRFHLQFSQILSKSTALNIASVLNKDIQLNTSDVSATIDLVANKGKFVNNAATNQAKFSSSQYKCSFEGFTWYMKDSYLNIGIEDPVWLAKIWKIEDLSKLPTAGRNLFVSTNHLLDSLNFIAPLARYDLKNGNIDCHWVNHIDVANGRFYPANGDIAIHSDGTIQEFTAGKLLCEREDTSKILTDVNFSLKGRLDFNGSGNFIYTDEDKKQSVIRFTEIGTDTLKLIFAKAQMKEEAPLLLNQGFKYKGTITLYSRQPDLYFMGYVGLTTDKNHLNHHYVAVRDYLSSRQIRIPLKVENKNDKQERVYNGIYLTTDKIYKPYAAFISNRIFYKDDLLIGGEGKMEWSSAMKQYIISDTLRDKFYRFRYDPEANLVSAYGIIHLDLKLPGMYQKIAGNISYDLEKEEVGISDALYLVDFTILTKMEGVLLKDFADKKQKIIRVPHKLRENIYEISGKMAVPATEKKLGNTSSNIPDSLNRLFVIDSLSFRWNEQTHSYMANNRVNVVAIKGKAVDKVMNIKMEIQRNRAGNQYFMYIYDDNMWYYFEYSDQNLYTLSSNLEYNEVVKNEKAEKKIVQTKEKETLYTITLCPDSKKERFLKRIK